MRASNVSLLALSLVAGLVGSLPTPQSITFRGDYEGPDLLEQHSNFEPFFQSGQRIVEDKAIVITAPTILLLKTSTQQICHKQFSPKEDNVTVESHFRRLYSSGTSSSLEERSFDMDHTPRHLEAYGRVHDYALVCAGNRADTQYCQGEFLRYSCNSYGALVQRQGGYRSETCDSICVCVNLSPKPFCMSGYLGTTTCF